MSDPLITLLRADIAMLRSEREDALNDLQLLRQDNARLRAALLWLINLAHGVGKAGGKPETGEWEAAWEAAHRALNPEATDE